MPQLTTAMYSLCALLLTALALLAGCPRQPEPTAAQRGETPSTPSSAEQHAMPMPLGSLELPDGATAEPLPDELVADYEGAEVSEDRTRMHVAFDGEALDYWFVCFSVPEDDHAALLQYYTAVLGRDGMLPNEEVNSEARESSGYFQGVWASEDGQHAVRVYNFDHAAAEAGENVPFVLLYQDRSQ